MSEISADDLIEQAQIWLNWLGVAEQKKLTLEELIAIISYKREKPIEIVAGVIPPHFGLGITTLKEDRYLIGVDEKVTGPLLLTVKCHELVHIMFGDVEKGIVRRQAMYQESEEVAEVNCQIELHLDPINERIVEYVAECLAEKISNTQSQSASELLEWLR